MPPRWRRAHGKSATPHVRWMGEPGFLTDREAHVRGSAGLLQNAVVACRSAVMLLNRVVAFKRRDAGGGDRLRHPEVKFQSKWSGNLFLEELAQLPMVGINSP